MKGILFKEDMFKAVIENRKTQTRRTGGLDMVNIDPDYEIYFEGMERDPDVFRIDKNGEVVLDKWDEPKLKTLKGYYALFEGPFGDFEARYFRPKYQPGETVYLKEPYCKTCDNYESIDAKCCHLYATGHDRNTPCGPEWKNKLFMPESAARYFIKITDVKVERVQDITNNDAHNEGVYFAKSVIGNCYLDYINGGCNILTTAYNSFRSLWKKINGKESWEKNPWVFVYHFELIK